MVDSSVVESSVTCCSVVEEGLLTSGMDSVVVGLVVSTEETLLLESEEVLALVTLDLFSVVVGGDVDVVVIACSGADVDVAGGGAKLLVEVEAVVP